MTHPYYNYEPDPAIFKRSRVSKADAVAKKLRLTFNRRRGGQSPDPTAVKEKLAMFVRRAESIGDHELANAICDEIGLLVSREVSND